MLFLGWQIGAGTGQTQASSATTDPGSSATNGSSTAGTSSSGTSASTGTPSPSSSSSSSPNSNSASGSGTTSPATLKNGTFTGNSVQTQFGNVQVEVTIASGKVTDVKALQLTSYGGRSVQISNYAAPILRSEVLKAQSANVATVSGATYTTEGYLTSVQSALDKAKA